MQDFIDKGTIGTVFFRRQLVAYISDFLMGLPSQEPSVDGDTAPFLEAIKSFLLDEKIQALCQQYQGINKEIEQEILQFLRDMERVLRHECYAITFEKEAFLDLKKMDFEAFKSAGIDVLKPIKKYFNTDFYEYEWYSLLRQLQETGDPIAFDKELQKLKEHLQAAWQHQIFVGESKKKLLLLDRERKRLLEELYKKIIRFNQVKDLLAPFTDNFGRLWDLGKGKWQLTDFDIIRRYADLLEKDKRLQDLAEIIGRNNSSSKKTEEEAFQNTITFLESKFDFAQKSEFIGIRHSDDLSNLLPSEIALLANPATEPIFFRNFVEKKLQTWEYKAKYAERKQKEITDKRLKNKETDKGPMIICIDTSGSMSGEPEEIAKMLCFAILKIAARDHRLAYLISFSDEIETLELSDLSSCLPKLIEFLRMSFCGGTDIVPPLAHALDILAQKNYEKADVLVISDFVLDDFEDGILPLRISKAKNKETKFYALIIGNSQNTSIIESFDQHWVYDPENPDAILT